MLISELLRCQVLFASIKLESKDASAAPLASPKKCSDLVILQTTMWGPDLRALLNSSGSVIADYARQPEQHLFFDLCMWWLQTSCRWACHRRRTPSHWKNILEALKQFFLISGGCDGFPSLRPSDSDAREQ